MSDSVNELPDSVISTISTTIILSKIANAMSDNFKNLASKQDTLTVNFPTIHRTYTMNKTRAVGKCTATSNCCAMHRTYTMNKMRALNKCLSFIHYCAINRTYTMNKNKTQPIIIATKPCENTPFLQGFYVLIFFYLFFPRV